MYRVEVTEMAAGPLADKLMSEINGIRRAVRRRLRARGQSAAPVSDPALSTAQIELLRVVEDCPGIGVAAVAAALQLAGNSVSAPLNQLVDAGYLRRETDPADRRAARLHLTPAASARLSAWRAARAELVGAALDGLPEADRCAIAGALPALGRLADRLREVGRPDEREAGRPDEREAGRPDETVAPAPVGRETVRPREAGARETGVRA